MSHAKDICNESCAKRSGRSIRNKKALCESQQVKLATTHTEPMLKINPNGLLPNANTAQILQNSQIRKNPTKLATLAWEAGTRFNYSATTLTVKEALISG